MGGQATLLETVRKFILYVGGTLPLLDSSGDHRRVPVQDQLMKGCTAHTGGITRWIPLGGINMAYYYDAL